MVREKTARQLESDRRKETLMGLNPQEAHAYVLSLLGRTDQERFSEDATFMAYVRELTYTPTKALQTQMEQTLKSLAHNELKDAATTFNFWEYSFSASKEYEFLFCASFGKDLHAAKRFSTIARNQAFFSNMKIEWALGRHAYSCIQILASRCFPNQMKLSNIDPFFKSNNTSVAVSPSAVAVGAC